MNQQPSPETAKLLLILIRNTSLPILIKEKKNKRKGV
jgi:hypothetical protein